MIDLFQICAVVGFLIAVAFHRGIVLKVLGMLVWAGAYAAEPGPSKYWAMAAVVLAIASLVVTARASAGRVSESVGVRPVGSLGFRAWTGVAVAAVLIVSLVLAMDLGRRAAESDVARLDADLRISVLSLPTTDRALLAALARECNLSARPSGRSETLDCLRLALPSVSLDPKVFPEPLTQLESLLSGQRSSTGR